MRKPIPDPGDQGLAYESGGHDFSCCCGSEKSRFCVNWDNAANTDISYNLLQECPSSPWPQ